MTSIDQNLFAITEERESGGYGPYFEPESKGIFKSYSTMSLFELKRLITELSSEEKIIKI